MEIKAKLSYLRISPRKVRLVTDLIRGISAVNAEQQLRFAIKKGALPVLKLLNSAIANAKHNFGIEKENLYIAKIVVNTAPMLKRWKARSRGMANPIKKRSSHIELILMEKGGVHKTGKKIAKKEGKSIKLENLEISKKAEKSEKLDKSEKKTAFRPEKERPTRFKKEGFGQKIFRRKAF